ncbi:hypothetical protein B0I37DRAFT_384545 [Chaetomium sp. MPI-CAGE-AT-0009]|nr:hypothetical protein B0I37DRAFT_384545 [Chaetomium sp. MPI-CAGE-AT-0009]
MASRIKDEETGVAPQLSQKELGTDSRPPTRRGSPPPQHELNSPIQSHPAPTCASARSSTGNLRASHGLDVENPEKWIWKKYGRHLVRKVQPWPFTSSNQGEESFEVNLAEVQHMYLVQLRVRLATHIARWERSGGKELTVRWNRQRRKNGNGNDDDDENTEAEDCWEDDLHKYVQALQDYDYIDKSNQTERKNPFHMTGEKKLDRIIFDAPLGNAKQPRFDGMSIRDVRKWDSHLGGVVQTPSYNRYKRLVGRLGVSAIGATFLIAPMWLMMLRSGLYVALISTTVFVAVFGVFAASFLDEHVHILSNTAAYAAVLVVFVGLTSEASTAQK